MPDEKPNDVSKIVVTKFEQSDNFASSYANNVFFSTSIFDIKMVFGDIVQFPNAQPYVEQHTAITLSWREAKIAALFLAMNVAMHENQFGALDIPAGILPANFQRTAEEGKLPLTKLMEFVEHRPPVKPDGPAAESGATKT
jgi:hypothetical protein